MGQKENVSTKENVKKSENSEQIDINFIDVAFYILLVIVVICLIPYMSYLRLRMHLRLMGVFLLPLMSILWL